MKKARRVTRRTAAEFFSEEVELEEREEFHTPQGRGPCCKQAHPWQVLRSTMAGALPRPGGTSWTSWGTLACSWRTVSRRLLVRRRLSCRSLGSLRWLRRESNLRSSRRKRRGST